MGSAVVGGEDGSPNGRGNPTFLLEEVFDELPSLQMPRSLIRQNTNHRGELRRFGEFERERCEVARRLLEDLNEVTEFDQVDFPMPHPTAAESQTVLIPSVKWDVTGLSAGFPSQVDNQLPIVDLTVYILAPGKPPRYGGVKSLRMLREPDPVCKQVISKIKPFNLIDKRLRQVNPYNVDVVYPVPAGMVGHEIDEEYMKKHAFQGVFLLHSGTCFKGELKNLKRHGYGELITNQGEFRQGTFTHRGLNGLGRVVTVQGVIYQGNFTDDKPNGSGAMIDMQHGIKFHGKFVNGLPHGKGKIVYRDPEYSPDQCATYEGDFYEGAQTGSGKKTYFNGDVYEGKFVDGLPEEPGKINCPINKIKLPGILKDGQFVIKQAST